MLTKRQLLVWLGIATGYAVVELFIAASGLGELDILYRYIDLGSAAAFGEFLVGSYFLLLCVIFFEALIKVIERMVSVQDMGPLRSILEVIFALGAYFTGGIFLAYVPQMFHGIDGIWLSRIFFGVFLLRTKVGVLLCGTFVLVLLVRSFGPRFPRTSLFVRYLIAAAVIMALGLLMCANSVLEKLEPRLLNAFDSFRVTKQFQASREGKLGQNSITGKLYLNTMGISNEKYLRLCSGIVDELVKARAKAVFIQLPTGLLVTDSVESLLERMSESGIVIFGEKPRASWKTDYVVGHPLYHRSNIRWGVVTLEYNARNYSIGRITPYRAVDNTDGAFVPDVSLQLVKLYLGYPARLPIQVSSTEVTFGNVSIPIMKDGSAFIALRDFSSEVAVDCEVKADTLYYHKGGVSVSSLDVFQNKIAIVRWYDVSMEDWEYPYFVVDSYDNTIRSILENSIIRRIESWDSIICVVLPLFFMFISMKFRPARSTLPRIAL